MSSRQPHSVAGSLGRSLLLTESSRGTQASGLSGIRDKEKSRRENLHEKRNVQRRGKEEQLLVSFSVSCYFLRCDHREMYFRYVIKKLFFSNHSPECKNRNGLMTIATIPSSNLA